MLAVPVRHQVVDGNDQWRRGGERKNARRSAAYTRCQNEEQGASDDIRSRTCKSESDIGSGVERSSRYGKPSPFMLRRRTWAHLESQPAESPPQPTRPLPDADRDGTLCSEQRDDRVAKLVDEQQERTGYDGDSNESKDARRTCSGAGVPVLRPGPAPLASLSRGTREANLACLGEKFDPGSRI